MKKLAIFVIIIFGMVQMLIGYSILNWSTNYRNDGIGYKRYNVGDMVEFKLHSGIKGIILYKSEDHYSVTDYNRTIHKDYVIKFQETKYEYFPNEYKTDFFFDFELK